MARPTATSPGVTSGGPQTQHDDTVTIGASTTHVVLRFFLNSQSNTTVALDPAGANAAMTELGNWTVSGGGGHRLFIVDVSALGLSGAYTLRATTNDSRSSSMLPVVVADAATDGGFAGGIYDYDAENGDNGAPGGLTLSGVGTNDLLLTIFHTRENRSESASGDLDTNLIDTSAQDAAVARVDTGDTDSVSIDSDYTASGWPSSNLTGFVHTALVFAEAAAAGGIAILRRRR